uniref:Moesin/ezrin/radixin homolog 1 n=2 Tax=Caenorhabditis tropicalis TaxID=1561998 RepID=A0A1I7T979_9PELO
MSNIPRGVGAPPPPGMISSKRGRLVCIKVRMLDDTVAVFHLGHKAIGQTLLDEVCRHLNLLECDYFGLSFIDINQNHCWLDREKTILRQITNGSTDAKFYFVVKFYTPNPIDLEEEYTRYLFTMQIKRDLAMGELHCSDNTASLLSAYLVQSECGDFSSEDYPDATYLSHTRFVPNQTLEFQKKVMDNHRNFIGMTPGESDLAMLEVARRCDFYGVKLHAAKDIDGNDAALSVMHLGIKVFRQLQPLRSAASTRKGTYSSTYGLVSDRPIKHRNGSVYEPNQTDPYNKHQNTHSSMPHIAHISSQPADHSFSGTLDARVGTSVTRDPSTTVTQHRLRQLKRSERCISDVDTVERPQRSSCRPVSNAINVSSVSSKEQPDLSISLPNVLSDDLQMVCKEIEMEQNDPPKSVSGDNFQQRRSSRDYDNVSEDSYRLSDHERSTRSEVGVGSKHAAATIFNSTFVARKPGSNVVKRVVAHSKSTPNSTDDEEGALKSVSEYQTFRHIKEYPFARNANIVPIEIDGPNVDISARRSPIATTTTTRVTPHTTTTVTTTSKVLTSSGAVLMKPKVIQNDQETSSGTHSSRVSPESGTYGALGPLPGRVLAKENMMVTPEGFKEKKPKPNPPPKPSFPIQAVHAETEVVREVKTERASSHPLVHMQEEIPFSRAPLKFEEQKERKSSLSRPALISVQSEDNPDVQKCHLFNSDIPYTLTMRNGYESNSLKRVSKSPEFKRRKSLDLVPRKRLPSPGNFSAQDHTISPTTPDSDVLEYLLRRKSLIGDKSVIKSKSKRTDPRRQTQPVRFDLPPSPCSPTAGGSTPFISILNDDLFDECVSESRSLHEDMDRLDKSTPHNQSISSFMSQKSRRDSEDSDVMPPPPDEILHRAAISSSRPAPPPPPPKSLAAAVKVAEMKAAAAGKMPYSGSARSGHTTDSPPFIDDSPKNSSASEAPSVSSPQKDGLSFADF